MLLEKLTRRLGKATTIAATAVALAALAMPLKPANAQIYLGWDFGSGFGVGIGTPPSVYSPCPNYGWPGYHPCVYRPY